MIKLPPKPKAFEYFDEEEREIIEAFERGEFTSLPEKEAKKLKADIIKAAQESVAAKKMIQIEIRARDLRLLNQEAEAKGISYQTLIDNILHQHSTKYLHAI